MGYTPVFNNPNKTIEPLDRSSEKQMQKECLQIKAQEKEKILRRLLNCYTDG